MLGTKEDVQETLNAMLDIFSTFHLAIVGKGFYKSGSVPSTRPYYPKNIRSIRCLLANGEFLISLC